MIRGLKNVPPTDAIGVSSSLLATAVQAARLPAGAGTLATVVAPVIPQLQVAAQVSHDRLVASLAERDGKVIGRGSEVQDAKEVEKSVDRRVSALFQRLDSLIKDAAAGAEALQRYLFPEGLTNLTRLTGRPQRGRYDQWVLTWTARPAQGSAADLDVASSMARLEDEIRRFGDVLDGKDNMSRRATGAIDGAGTAFQGWVDAMGELALAIEVLLASEPARYDNWISPYTEWRNAQTRARRAAGEDTPVNEDSVDVDPGPAVDPTFTESPGPQ